MTVKEETLSVTWKDVGLGLGRLGFIVARIALITLTTSLALAWASGYVQALAEGALR
ncbi:MAG TPA: hypothetical protein VFE48_10010 [Methylomirabilota bacterium]|nr:hypothetical protein [Methylomirabilota bacterium]